MGRKTKWILDLLFLILVMGATLWGLLRGRDLGTLWARIRGADVRWLIPGPVLVVLFILGESLVLHDIFRTMGTAHRLGHCFLYSFIGFFFSCITPSAGGGQPAQVYFMKKDGIPVSASVPVMILVTITYKFVLILFGGLVFLLRPAGICGALRPVWGWCVLGMVLNVAFVGFYVALLLWPGLVERFLLGCLSLWNRLARLRPVSQERLLQWTGTYRNAADCFRARRLMILRVTALTVLQRSILFSVTWLVLRAFGVEDAGPGTVIVLQSMISLGTDLLPLPGGMGASETMFLRIFSPLWGEAPALTALMVSRGISYYGQLLISAVFSAAAVFIIGGNKEVDA